MYWEGLKKIQGGLNQASKTKKMTCGPATDHRNKKCVLTTKSLQTEAKGSGPCQGLDWPGGWSRLPPRPLRGRPRAAVSPSLQDSLVLDKVHSPLLQFGSTCFAATLFILWSVAGPQKSKFQVLQRAKKHISWIFTHFYGPQNFFWAIIFFLVKKALSLTYTF